MHLVNRQKALAFSALITLVILLSGCAAAVVGGAAVGAAAAHDRRSAGVMIDDQAIEVRAMDTLHQEGGPGRGNHIKATSYNRTVLLTGEVREAEDRARAEEIVSAIPNVVRVVNELGIGEPTGLPRRSRDTMLTGQVKSSLLGTGLPGFDPARVKVVSVRGNVYLMGLVTEQEAEMIVDKIAGLRGVRKVVKVFDYIPEGT